MKACGELRWQSWHGVGDLGIWPIRLVVRNRVVVRRVSALRSRDGCIQTTGGCDGNKVYGCQFLARGSDGAGALHGATGALPSINLMLGKGR